MDANEFRCRAFLAAMGEAYRALLLGTNQSNHDWAAAYCERAADAALAVAQRRGMVTGERTASAPAAKPAPDVIGWLAAQESPQSWGPRFGVWRPSSGEHQERRFYAKRVVYDKGVLWLAGEESGPEVSHPVRVIMRGWTRVDAAPKAPAKPEPDAAAFRRQVIMVDDVATEPGGATHANVRGVIEQRMADRRVGPVVAAGVQGPELERVEFTAERDGDLWVIRGGTWQTNGLHVRAGEDSIPVGASDVVRIKWGETMPPKPIEVWLERR